MQRSDFTTMAPRFAACMFLIATVVFAQLDTGNITVTIKDASGKKVASGKMPFG